MKNLFRDGPESPYNGAPPLTDGKLDRLNINIHFVFDIIIIIKTRMKRSTPPLVHSQTSQKYYKIIIS